MYLFLTAIQGMNAQNNDSSSKEILPLSQNIWEVSSVKAWGHPGILDSITHLFHKKSPVVLLHQENISQKEVSSNVIPDPLIVSETVQSTDIQEPLKNINKPPWEGTDSALSEKKTLSISDQIAGLFHKKHPEEASQTTSWKISEIIESQPIKQTAEQVITPPSAKDEEIPPTTDERFSRLLAEDSIYQSMIRNQDIKNIRLQLSMRYMLLMLAIFVVMAWVVNNRVIMFWFYDFPLLSRIRDALFGVLTGLFCLTVWFGSVAWLNNKIGIFMLRGLALASFVVVIVSIYVPFWR